MSDVAPLRWGIVGTGGIATGFARELTAMADATVVAVGSRTLERAQTFADAVPGLAGPPADGTADDVPVPRAHGSLADLVADPDVEAVYVATPHPMHLEGALAAIGAGKHVLVEKAFTMDADEARQIVDAARAAGVFCMEAMWTRWLPHARRIRELVAGGAIGEVVTVVADHGQYFTPDPAHRLFAPDLGGSALLDLGVYPVSWASMLLGTPTSLVAAGEPAATGVDATTSAVLRHGSGAQALVTCTSGSATPRRSWISGTLGTIEVDPTFYALTGFTLRRRDGHEERFEPAYGELAALVGTGPDGRPRGKGMAFEAAEVARCVRAGLTESPDLPLDETLAIMTTMDEIRRQTGL